MDCLPCGAYIDAYGKDMRIFRTWPQRIALLLFLIVLFTLPLYASRSILSVIAMIGILVIAVEGLGILTGFAGQISIGQAAFVGVGAYLSVIFNYRLGMPFVPAVLLASISTGFIGLLFGLPAMRVKGFYLAMTTLAAQFILVWLFLHMRGLTGGTNGLFVEPAMIFGYKFSSYQSKYLLVMVVTAIMVILAKNLMRTRTGRAFVAIRDNDLAADVMGINQNYYKLVAFFIANFFAGVSGAMWAYYVNFINADQFLLHDSILYLGMLIIGGMGSIMGPIFGVSFLKILEEITIYIAPIISEIYPEIGSQFFAALSLAVFAIVIILFLIFESRGINHKWVVLKNRFRLYPFTY